MGLKPHTTAAKMEGRPPDFDWEAGYVRYRPMLFRALSKLARQGLAARPDDGLDLIHDFFSETWLSVVGRFDPSKGKFEPYIYGCFLRFARPRLVRLSRWQGSLLPLEELAELSDRRDHAESRTHEHDIAAIRTALDSLPKFDREVLLAYVASNRTSERQLASRFNVTRFRLRSSLAAALGNLAVSLKEPTAFDETEWAILRQLSQEGRTVKETARALELTAAEVQAVRARILTRLLDAAKASSRRTRMATTSTGPEALLSKALDPSTDKNSVVVLLRGHIEEIVAFLESDRADAFFVAHSRELDSDRIEAIYGALGLEGEIDPEDKKLCDAFLIATRAEEDKIGEAFGELLLNKVLPSKLWDFDQLFLGADPVSAELRDMIEKERSVVSGGAAAQALAKYGITPVTVSDACEGVANLAKRLCDDRSIPVGRYLILDNGGKDVSHYKEPVLPRSESIREVMLITELGEKHAERLFGWICRVGAYVPRLFNGFDSALWGDQLRLTRTDEMWTNFFEGWAPIPPQQRLVA